MVREEHQPLAPALIRSQLLALLYQALGRAELTATEAERRLDYIRGLRLRLLGDRVLQRVAWQYADQLGCSDTYDAEYVALTRLQADALLTLDSRLAEAVESLRSSPAKSTMSRTSPRAPIRRHSSPCLATGSR